LLASLYHNFDNSSSFIAKSDIFASALIFLSKSGVTKTGSVINLSFSYSNPNSNPNPQMPSAVFLSNFTLSQLLKS